MRLIPLINSSEDIVSGIIVILDGAFIFFSSICIGSGRLGNWCKFPDNILFAVLEWY